LGEGKQLITAAQPLMCGMTDAMERQDSPAAAAASAEGFSENQSQD